MRELASVHGHAVFRGLDETPRLGPVHGLALPGKPASGVASITGGSIQGELILSVLTEG